MEAHPLLFTAHYKFDPRVLVIPTLFLLGAIGLQSAADPEPDHRVPVLLELFTSEGCSSCPPADKLLQKLDQKQPIEGADLIVLSEHVDYWNNGGWSDPYSSPQFSKRQQRYADQLDSDVYTPQLIIDGRSQVVGSDLSAVEDAVRTSERVPETPVTVQASKDGNAVSIHVAVAANSTSKPAVVYLALAADRARSHVTGGENGGRELEHVAVVQSLTKIGDTSGSSVFEKNVRAALSPNQNSGNMRVVVFVQDAASGHVSGVGQGRF